MQMIVLWPISWGFYFPKIAHQNRLRTNTPALRCDVELSVIIARSFSTNQMKEEKLDSKKFVFVIGMNVCCICRWSKVMLEKINDQMITHCNSSAIIIQMFTVDNLLHFWSKHPAPQRQKEFRWVFFI